MTTKKLYALRGASQCRNEEADIALQTVSLYDELLLRNALREADVVSAVFSVTGDLDAKNPAAALRETGRAGNTALFVTQEAAFRGSLPRTLRALIHCYLPEGAVPVHIYRNGAEALRPDWAGGVTV